MNSFVNLHGSDFMDAGSRDLEDTAEIGCAGLPRCFGCGSPGTPAGRARGLFNVVFDRMSVSGWVLGSMSARGKRSIGPETSIVAEDFERELFGQGNNKNRCEQNLVSATDDSLPVSLEPGL